MYVGTVGVIAILAMFALLFLGVPVAISMALPALVGIAYISGLSVLTATVDSIIWNHAMSFPLATIPLFVLMGEVLYESGITRQLYGAIRAWFGRVRGGLALSSIGASAVLAASSGSSVATTGTMGVVASKEMLDAKYDQRLVGGSIVAGGGLGILIPPSTLLILYGTLTQESIGQLLMAGLIPGLVMTVLLSVTVLSLVATRPAFAPGAGRTSWQEKFRSVVPVSAVLLLFLIVMGSLYSGYASPTEAAALGALGAIFVSAVKGQLGLRGFVAALGRSARTTGFIFAIVLGSFLLNHLLAVTQLANRITTAISGLDAPNVVIFVAIVLMYLALGAFMDSFAMVVITVPLVLPVVNALGLDPIWFGVVLVVLVEIALITPPVGMNNFVLKGVAPDLEMGAILRGAAIFVIPMLVLVALLYAVPDIALFLPSKMW